MFFSKEADMNLQGKCAIISGASQGLGLEIAKQYVLAGASIMMCARNKEVLFEAQQKLQQMAGSANKVFAQVIDVSRPEESKLLVETTLQKLGSIDVLVANAGVYGPKGLLEEIEWQAWSDAIDINLKGTVLQCAAVLPHMKQKKAGKIIILSGGGATKPMPYFSAYAASKAAVVRFAETLSQEVQKHNIDVNAVAPGALNTRLLEEVLAAGPEKVGKEYYEQSKKQKESGGNSIEMAAALCTFLAGSEGSGISGKLISAVWDPWKQLPEYIEELKNSDIYTLRRIVPKDRNKNWDTIL